MLHRLTIAILALSLVLPFRAQELPALTYPSLPRTVRPAEAFVPQGWVLEKQTQGDLNGDGRADLALVLRLQDPANIVPMAAQDVATKPRILAVAFAQADGGYALALENHTLIPRQSNPIEGDPFNSNCTDRLSIDHGTLRIKLFGNISTYAFTFR